MAQNNFGLNNNPKSFRVLRTEESSTSVPTPQDAKLAALAQDLKLAGTLTPTTPPSLQKPGSASDLITPTTVGVNRLLSKAQSLSSEIRQPLNDLSNASRQAGRAVRDIQGIVQQGALIRQDFNNAIGEAKKLGQLLGLFQPEQQKASTSIAEQINKLIGVSQSSSKADNLSPESSQVFDRVRIAWTLTTQAQLLGKDSEGRNKEPVKFFVNPSKVAFNSGYVESLEFVQKGNFYSRWKSQKDNRAFPNLGLQFTFQSSNILPETYSSSSVTVDEGPIEYSGSLYKGLDRDYTASTAFRTPPGIKNFFDILEILNAPTIIDASQIEGLSDEEKREWDGQPNFVILRLSTRTFPLMTAQGFFQQGWSLEEDAENPLSFTIPLQMVVFKSDPPWWDRSQIIDRYNNFYQKWIEAENQDAALAGSILGSLEAQSALSGVKRSSDIDQETLEAQSGITGDDSPTSDAEDPGNKFENFSDGSDFGDDTQYEIALGVSHLGEFGNPKSPLYDSKSTSLTSRVGDGVQTTVQLSNGQSYVQFQGDGVITTTWRSGQNTWTCNASKQGSDGLRDYQLTNASGQVRSLGRFK